MSPHSIRIVPKRDDARAVVPGPLAHLSNPDGRRGLAGAPGHRGRLPTAEEQRVILRYFEITPAGARNG